MAEAPSLRDKPLQPAAHDAAVRSNTGRIGRTARAWSLGWLLYVFALALIAPLLGFAMFAANQMIIAERAAEEEQLRRAARMLSAAIDRELTRLTELLQALAGSGSLKDGDLVGFHRESSAAVTGTGHAILLVDGDLDQVINTRVPYGTPLLPIGDPDTARKVFATGKPAIGDLIMSRVAQRRVVTVMVPAIIDGGVRYVLVLSPDPATLSWILEQQDLPDGWFAGVSDRNDRTLARSARHHEFLGKPIPAETKAKDAGRSGVITTKSPEGDVVLHAYFWSDVSGWRTAVWVPLSILTAPARQLWRALAALAVAAFAVSLLAAAFVGRWLARPIAGVANAAAALGRGDPVGYAPCAIAEVNVVRATLAVAAEQRRQAEAALRESERRLRLALDIAAIGDHEIDLAGGTAAFDDRAKAILGLSTSALSIEESWKLAHPDDRAAIEAAAALALDPAGQTAAAEHRIIRPDGEQRWIHWRVRAAFDETAAPPRPVRLVGVMMDITERKRTEERLREALRLASVACEAGRMGAWHLDVDNNRLTYSDELLALIGIDKSQFGGTLEAVEAFTHPDDIERRRKDRANALAQGDWFEHDYRIMRPDGEVRWMHSRGKIVRRADGTAIQAYGMTLDITERKQSEEHIHFLMKELSHRTKNLMAVVQTISWQTAQKSLDLEDFEQRFTQRLEALARSQDLLVRRDWRGVELEDLVRAQLEPFLDSAEGRLAAHGPSLLLMPVAAQDLGLALHELATNASKYGALTVPTGKIEIGWTVDGGTVGAPRFRMTWRETGGPAVSPPTRKGFGSTVTTSSLSRSFSGEAKVDYRPEGVSWGLTAPMGHLVQSPSKPLSRDPL